MNWKLATRKTAQSVEDGNWLIPGDQAWEIRKGITSEDKSDILIIHDLEHDKLPPISLVALPSQYALCHLFWLETTDEKTVPDLLAMQCERRGLRPQNEVWNFRIVRRERDRLLAQALILQNLLPTRIEAETSARYEAWPCCLNLPARAICLWRSLRFITVAFTDDRGLIYFQSLPHHHLTPGCLHDLQAAIWVAVAQNWIPTAESLYMAGVWSSQEIARLEILQISIQTVSSFPLALLSEAMELTPHNVRLHRIKQRRQWRIRLIALVLGVLYAVFLLFHIGVGAVANASNARLEKRLNALLPEMTRLQQIARRMEALAPALNTKTYPLEILRQIMALLPESGVRLTRFEINGNRAEIRGESTTAREAFEFLHAIQSSDSLQHIEWEEPPQPVPLPNDTTRFSIQGTIAGAYYHAEES